MLSTPPPRSCARRSWSLALYLDSPAFGCCFRSCLAQRPSVFPFDRNSAEAAAAHRSQRGSGRGNRRDKGRSMGQRRVHWRALHVDRSFDEPRPDQLRTTRASQVPTRRRRWPSRRSMARHGFFWPDFRPARADAENRVGTLLEMSYFTAPSASELAPWRLERAATSSALADKDIQAFVKSDIREILNRRPEFQQAIIAAYRKRLAAESTDFRISCRRRRSRRGQIASLRRA